MKSLAALAQKTSKRVATDLVASAVVSSALVQVWKKYERQISKAAEIYKL